MHVFYTEDILDGAALFAPEDAKHAVRVLRLKPGEEIAVVAGGQRYAAAFLPGDRPGARLLAPLPSTEASVRITLYQGLTKGERMDYTVQKCTEVGVAAIVPCLMCRCVAREEKGKLSRWQRIAREAARQAQRTRIPEVEPLIDFDALCERIAGHGQALVPWEEGGQPLRAAYQGAEDVAVIIGPEGGITPEEIKALGAVPITLGPRILRAETAGLVAAAGILLLSGDMA
jgi:16S rRNA (uracil1498-N3)-methyltransferase